MIPTQKQLSVGIDGGGSGSRYVFCYEQETIAVSAHALQARLKTAGETADQIATMIKAVCEEHSYPKPAKITAGIAGAADPGLSRKLTRILQKHFEAAEITLMPDIAASFISTYQHIEAGCALLICGTGSALVYAANGELKVAGGFGPALNEYGSGRQLGRDFMTFLMHGLDKGELSSEVSTMLEKEGLNIRTRTDALRLLYSTGFNMASLAPSCLVLASEGHPDCLKITEQHLSAVIGLFETAFPENQRLIKVALHGGLFNNPWFLARMSSKLAATYPGISIIRSNPDTAGYLAKNDSFDVPHVCL